MWLIAILALLLLLDLLWWIGQHLYAVSGWLTFIYSIAVGWLLIDLLLQWIVRLQPNQMVARLLFGGYWLDTVANQTYQSTDEYHDWLQRIRQEDERIQAERERLGLPDHLPREQSVRTGIFGTFAFVPTPFVTGVIFPTSAFDLPIHIGDIFTKEDLSLDEPVYRTMLEQKVTLTIRLSPLLGKLFSGLDLLRVMKAGFVLQNLTEPCQIEDNDGHKYPSVRVAKVLLPLLQPAILEALRSAAANFTWLGNNDINEKRPDFERSVVQHLSQPESVSVQGGLLKEHAEVLSKSTRDRDSQYGEAAVSVDILIERIGFPHLTEKASDLEKKINNATIAKIDANAEAARRRGIGEGRLQEATKSELSTREILEYEMVKEVDELKVNSVDKSVVDAVTGALTRFQQGGGPRQNP